MRIDIPREIPRRREPEAARPAPLPPSPFEQRREHLEEQARTRHVFGIPAGSRNRSLHPKRNRESHPHTVPHDRPMDRRPRRQTIAPQIIGVSLRAEERKVLAEVGRFRVISTRDLAATIYDNRSSLMKRDLAFLHHHGLVQVDAVNARRDGRGGKVERIEVVTLTSDGKAIARRISGFPQDQRLYAGMVKPREVEHDARFIAPSAKKPSASSRRAAQTCA